MSQKKFSEQFFDILKEMDKNALIGLSLRLLDPDDKNSAIGEADTDEKKEFRVKLAQFLKQPKEHIISKLNKYNIEQNIIDSLIGIVEKNERPTIENDLYKIISWRENYSIKEFEQIIDIILKDTYLYDNLPKIDDILGRLDSNEITIEERDFLPMYRLFRLAVIDQVTLGEKSPERLRRDLIETNEDADDLINIMIDKVENNLGIIEKRALMKEILSNSKKINKINKKLDKLTDFIGNLFKDPSEKKNTYPPDVI
ncbi:MAG: hypothetical protein EU541_07030 [Promethearchaeota archaeon]|nr:MAG: hypothetical protein EU541_07030 [Candidatus Lokiarchaeota archaeon]